MLGVLVPGQRGDPKVWLQGWPVGEHVELHDHGGVSGALCVVEGRLVEASAAGPDATRLRRRRLDTGAVSAFGPDYIHDVVNAGQAQALSIQVYSPRLVSMTFYAVATGWPRGGAQRGNGSPLRCVVSR